MKCQINRNCETTCFAFPFYATFSSGQAERFML